MTFPWESADIKEVIEESTYKLHRDGNCMFLYIKVCKGAKPRIFQGVENPHNKSKHVLIRVNTLWFTASHHSSVCVFLSVKLKETDRYICSEGEEMVTVCFELCVLPRLPAVSPWEEDLSSPLTSACS